MRRSRRAPSTIVSETYTDNWDPGLAQTEMEQFLTAANNDVQAVLAENDGMAGGVVAALEAQGLAGQVPVSGQDGDTAALNRVALGTQTVERLERLPRARQGSGRGSAPTLRGPRRHEGRGECPVHDARGGSRVTSIILNPIPIKQDNLDVVLDAGVIDKATLCQGVEAGSVPACG